jgi:hypothetical protein
MEGEGLFCFFNRCRISSSGGFCSSVPATAFASICYDCVAASLLWAMAVTDTAATARGITTGVCDHRVREYYYCYWT